MNDILRLRAAMHATADELGIGHSEVLAVSMELDVEIVAVMKGTKKKPPNLGAGHRGRGV